MGKIVLIDGNSIANRAFYALPLLTNKQGIYTNAVYGFAQIILKILDDIKPDYILVAFDAGKKTFRHSQYAEYKGTRQKSPSELSGQFSMIKELLDSFQIKYFELEGYEADDIIGTIAKLAENENQDTIIYTGDKDMLQLVSEHVSVYLTRKGITEVDKYDPQAVMDKYQLTPQQIVDLKGLMGDSSDNIPGVPGIGEKTALKLLYEYQTVEDVIAHSEDIKGAKLKENLAVYKEQALLSKQLATIFCNVPIGIAVKDMHYQKFDETKILDLFNQWEFYSLIDRLGIEQYNKNEVLEIESKIETFSEANKEEWNEKFIQNKLIALHVETNETSVHDYEILGISLSDGDNNLFLTLNQVISWQELLDWLSNSQASKLVYDGKKINLSLYWQGIQFNGVNFDLMLGAYLLNPSDGAITLAEAVRLHGYHGLQADELIYGKGAKRAIPAESMLIKHVGQKAQAIYKVTDTVREKLADNNLTELFANVELPLSIVLSDMEKEGIMLDTSQLNKMEAEISEKLTELTNEIYSLAGTEFNINSPKQLGEVLFDKLQLPVIKKTKTGYSTSADILEKLEPLHPIIGSLLFYRQLGKLHSTYIEGLKKVVNPKTKKIHTSFNQAITATGRLSSTEPNLQNIPIRLEEGRKIRQAFIPQEKGWKILAADYSQIELRILAHISNDKNLIEAFINDMDIHTKTAMDIFGIGEDEVTSNMRRQAKAVNFGIVYGISDYGLSQNLNISRKEAGEFIDKYFSVFSGVKKYMEEIIKQARKEGYVSTLLNRRRYLPDINSSNFNLRSFAERTAMNTPIQGTAADIIKIAMVKIHDKIKQNNLQSKMLLQVHDELIFEVDPQEIEQVKALVKDTMEQAIELNVPLKVDINLGDTWYEAK